MVAWISCYLLTSSHKMLSLTTPSFCRWKKPSNVKYLKSDTHPGKNLLVCFLLMCRQNRLAHDNLKELLSDQNNMAAGYLNQGPAKHSRASLLHSIRIMGLYSSFYQEKPPDKKLLCLADFIKKKLDPFYKKNLS